MRASETSRFSRWIAGPRIVGERVWRLAVVAEAIGGRTKNDVADGPDFVHGRYVGLIKNYFNIQRAKGGFLGGVKAKFHFFELETLAVDFGALAGDGDVLRG